MNIVLIGYRGTGKSIVGHHLSKRLKMECISMDARIVEKAGMSIPEFVEKYDWPKFRDLESEIAQELALRDNTIIDSGGGVIERPENITVLQKNAQLFWLKASIGLIISRIATGTERPSLTGKSFTDEVAEVLERRTPIYQSAAHFEIDTEELTPEQVADSIIQHLDK